MPRIEIDSELCKACKLCIGVCPQKIIELGEVYNSKGYYYAKQTEGGHCIGCKMCAIICPDAAITVYQ
jgi:2-oxoglutarate ferredoxin oxidoreductase subunit delta